MILIAVAVVIVTEGMIINFLFLDESLQFAKRDLEPSKIQIFTAPFFSRADTLLLCFLFAFSTEENLEGMNTLLYVPILLPLDRDVVGLIEITDIMI